MKENMVISIDIFLNPSVIPEYVLNNNRVSSNDTTLKDAMSPDCMTHINQGNNKAITKINIYKDNNCVESVSSNESYKNYWKGEMKVYHKSPLTIMNILNLIM